MIGRLLEIQASDTSVSDWLNPRLWLTAAMGGLSTTSGQNVNAESAMGLSAYFDCIRVIAEDVGKLPLPVYKRLKPRGKERDRLHPLYRVLHDQPNPYMSSMVFRETIQGWALGWGNGYAQIVSSGGKGAPAMYPIHPAMVTVTQEAADEPPVYWVKGADGQRVPIRAEEMLHIRGFGDNALSGISVFQKAAESLGLSIAVQEFAAAFYGNGATMGGVLEHPGQLGDKALVHLREQMNERHKGSANAHKMLITEEGMKYSAIGIPPEQAQFIETRKFQAEEVARWFRVPPHKIALLDRATFSNIEQQSIDYVTDTLSPWLTRWEQEIQRKLIGDDDHFAEHLLLGLLRGDQAARSAYYTAGFNIGAFSQNDVRELENMNPVEGGDVYYVPMNMRASDGSTDAAQQSALPAAVADVPDTEAKVRTLKGTHRRIVAAEGKRLAARESKARAGAEKKYANDEPALALWLADFRMEQDKLVWQAVKPAVESLVVLVAEALGVQSLAVDVLDVALGAAYVQCLVATTGAECWAESVCDAAIWAVEEFQDA